MPPVKAPAPFVVKSSAALERCLAVPGVSEAAYADLRPFLELVTTLGLTASRYTHYDRLDEWSEQAYAYPHALLAKYGFVQAQQAQHPDARFWYNVYWLISSLCYSPNMRTTGASHHASAWERNETLRVELDYLLRQVGA